MLKMLTQLPNRSISKVKALIDDESIRTWQYSNMSNGNTRLDWTGGKNNWPNLNEKVYFEAVIHAEDEDKKYISFVLHTKNGHLLNEAEFAQMHSELTGLLFTHVYSNIKACGVYKAKDKEHKVDVIDR